MILMRDATVSGQACRQRMVRYNTIQERKLEWNWERCDDGGRTWRVLWQIQYTRKTQVKKTTIIGGMNQNPLSPSAQKVDDALRTLGYHFNIIEHGESTRTAQEAAERAGCELGQIVKSLIFKGKVSGKPILVLTSGANRVDEKRISEYAGEAIGRADADFVRAVTGFAIGGVPPVGHIQKMETYLDEDFLQYETIWAAAGNPNAIFELPTQALHAMTDAKVIRIK
jgi:prolyl-tRNA editing enzyme YbaK/EbsC (Cys-tRNA(Pro) deacylase)